MNAHRPGPQEQKSRCPQARRVFAKASVVPLLARFWSLMWVIWGTVIVGGYGVGVFFSYLMQGASGLSQFDPRTWVILRPLLAHPLVTVPVLVVASLFTCACFLAARDEKREQEAQHQAQRESLVAIGRGVRRLLEEAQAQPAPRPMPPAERISTHTDPSPSSQSLFTVPYRQNPCFTGREHLLKLLHDQLTTARVAALAQALAISGLGGIGKTQTAIEYAWRTRHEYQSILWVRAASRETLMADFVSLAHQLELPERDLEDQQVIVAVVKRWLEAHFGWLLILDNADELALLPDFLPGGESGHILLTTRAQATGSIAPSSIMVEQMEQEEGALLLLRRARRIPSHGLMDHATAEERAQAAAIVTALGGLPLALDQVGAYIEETGCRLGDYLEIYHSSHRHELLQRRGSAPAEHPDPVATTLLLSFHHVERTNPAAADLLRLCAFLAPDAIPEMIITKGAQGLGEVLAVVAADVFLLNEAIEVLRRHSLVRRNPETKMLTVHRLVQAVLQDTLSVEMRKQWEERAINAMHAAFPGLEPSHWTECELWLPHAFVCATWITHEQIMVPATSRLLTQAGLYLKERGQYTQAESFLHQALVIDEQVSGPEHPSVATDLNDLACVYWDQGKYAETEPLFQRALSIRQHQLEGDDPAIAETLQNLASLYQTQGKHERAWQLFQIAVTIDEHRADATLAIDLGNQADLYRRLGHDEKAESLLERALTLQEKYVGQDHLDVAHLLQKQGLLVYEQGKLKEAESCFKRTLEVYEKWYGDEHPNTAQILNALADLARIQGYYTEAEPLFQRALTSKEKHFGEMHSSTAATLNGLALLYLQQGKYVVCDRCPEGDALAPKNHWSHIRPIVVWLKSIRKAAGAHGSWIFRPTSRPGNMPLFKIKKPEKYLKEGRFTEAESLFRRALTIRQQVLGEDHPNTALLLNNLACLYQTYETPEENEKAESLFLRALAVFERRLGREHPSTVQILHNLIYCYGMQGKYHEAQPLLEQALAVDEALSKHQHPRAQVLHGDLVFFLETLEWNAESIHE